MSAKSKMPPELLAHFKSKAEGKDGSNRESEDPKEKRKRAVEKARVRLESKNRRGSGDKENEAGKERS